MNNQQILDNAPEGATHFIQQILSVVYFKFDTHFIPLHWCNHKKGWRKCQFFEFNKFRLLADIKRIAELEKERDDFEALNSELYSIIFTHLGWWNLEGVNEIDHDDIIKALKEQE